MLFSTLLVGLGASVVSASTAIKQITPPKFFALQAETNSLTRNGSYNGYYIYQKQVSNLAAVVAPAPGLIPAEFYELTSPITNHNLTTYALLLATGSGKKGYVTPDLRYQAYWQALYLTYSKDSKPTPQQNQFFVGGSKSDMYLRMAPETNFQNGTIIGEGFQGWIICYWSSEIPQLFFNTAYGGTSPSSLPADCDYYNVKVIPLQSS